MLGRNRRKNEASGPDIELNEAQPPGEPHKHGYNHNGHKVTKGIKPEGESGRKGLHPGHFLRIGFRSTSKASMLVNVLWPFVPAAIAIHFARPDLHEWIFALNYIAMIPSANLVGFAGQELARKLPKVFGMEGNRGSNAE
jgi:Ca2+:H+ antiporter